jgi:hypothetical protein
VGCRFSERISKTLNPGIPGGYSKIFEISVSDPEIRSSVIKNHAILSSPGFYTSGCLALTSSDSLINNKNTLIG